MAAGKDLLHAPRGSVAVTCEIACWSALGVSLAALMWSVVEPKGSMAVASATNLAPEDDPVNAIVMRLSQTQDPFVTGLSANARKTTTEATGLTLHSTRTSVDGGGSAIIAVAGAPQGLYATGEELVPGTRLALVAIDHVELDVGGERMRLSFPGAQAAPALALAAQWPSGPADYRTAAGASSPLLLNSLALQPVSLNGRATGFEVMPQANGGPLSVAGLKPGDIVLSINGIDASNGGDLTAYRAQLTSGQPVVIRFERAGRVQTTTFGTRQ